MPYLYAPDQGIDRKFKVLYIPNNGINCKQKSLWAPDQGIDRKIYSGYDCHLSYAVDSYLNLVISGSVGSDGSGNFTWHWDGNSSSAVRGFTLSAYFDDDISIAQGAEIFRLNDALCVRPSASGSAYIGGQYVHVSHNGTVTVLSNSAGEVDGGGSSNYTFIATSNQAITINNGDTIIVSIVANLPVNNGSAAISWSSGAMYVLGKQINQVELI